MNFLVDILKNPLIEAVILALMTFVLYRNRERLKTLLHDEDPRPQVIDFVAMARDIAEKEAAAKQEVAPSPSRLEPAAQPAQLPTTAQYVKLSTVASYDNVLVVGQKGAGKTTLLRKIIATRASELLIALDPHAHPGKWPCRTIGGGRDYVSIGIRLEEAESDMDARFKDLARGKKQEGEFNRRSIVTDEYRSIADKLNGKKNTPDAGTLLLNRISEGRKVGECALVACHNDTTEALGIPGNSSMRTCFDFIVYMGGLVASQRTDKCPQEVKSAALQNERPAVAWLTEKNQWFVLIDDLPMPSVSLPSVSPSPLLEEEEEPRTSIPVQEKDSETGGIPHHTGTNTGILVSHTAVPVSHTAPVSLEERIKTLHSRKVSWNKIAQELKLKGSKQERNNTIRRALGIAE